MSTRPPPPGRGASYCHPGSACWTTVYSPGTSSRKGCAINDQMTKTGSTRVRPPLPEVKGEGSLGNSVILGQRSGLQYPPPPPTPTPKERGRRVRPVSVINLGSDVRGGESHLRTKRMIVSGSVYTARHQGGRYIANPWLSLELAATGK